MALTRSLTSQTIPGVDDYIFERELNHGHFGRVYSVIHRPTNKRWAAKVIEKRRLNPRQINNVFQEVKIMKKISHPNIIQLKEFLETQEYFILILELMKGGDLFDRLEKQTTFFEEDARNLLLQVALAVQYLHTQGIAHRDLKIENLMFAESDSNILKVGDFGLAKEIGGRPTKTPCGTKEYMAPEVVRGDYYYQSVDVWSLGCLAFILLYGTFPFYNETDSKGNRLIDVTDKIKKGYFTFPQEGEYENEPISELAKDLIRKSLVVDVPKRLTIEEFVEHPWLQVKRGNNRGALTNAPAAIRTAEGIVSMREYFNVGIHAERMRIDSNKQTNKREDMSIDASAESLSSLTENEENEGEGEGPDPTGYFADQLAEQQRLHAQDLKPIDNATLLKKRIKKKQKTDQ